MFITGTFYIPPRGKEKICCNCKYFIQHYILHEQYGFVPCNAGYCTRENYKNKTALQRDCNYFKLAREKRARKR